MIKVLIVDDSAVVRRSLGDLIAQAGDLELVGAAPDPYAARDLIVAKAPDVVTLDIEMPRMDGLSFLAKLMQHRPVPVIVISSLSVRGSDEAMRALQLGAVEVLAKPGSAFSVSQMGPQLIRAIRAAAGARLQPLAALPAAGALRPAPTPLGRTTSKLLAIGASTGGTEAIAEVIARLPGDTPGTIIVQHMPPLFTASFAKRLDGLGAMSVREAAGGEELLPGLAYVAPGGHHVVVVRSGAKYLLELRGGPQVHFQKPAVDVTFLSVAKAAAANAVGVILTGMGADGAAGLLAMRQAGAATIGQDEATCVVYGMPKAAYDLGAVAVQTPLGTVADRIAGAFRRLEAG